MWYACLRHAARRRRARRLIEFRFQRLLSSSHHLLISLVYLSRRRTAREPILEKRMPGRFIIAFNQTDFVLQVLRSVAKANTTFAESGLEPFCRRRQPSQPKQDALYS